MLVCVWLVSSLIHMISGCVLSESEPRDITGFTGDSVVLPCACTDVQRKPERVKWTAHSGNQSTVIFSQSTRSVIDRYKHRVQVLDSVSPGNLSVCLSYLTLSDGGTYRCEADGQHRDISLTVKGCVLSDSEPKHITGFTGDSVVLPCACTNVQKKPEWIKWTAHTGGQSTVIFLQQPANVGRYKDRVQVLDSIFPGNLSLHLSDLTLSDGGTYWCEADGHNRDISLTVKGCSLSAPKGVTGYTGGSVVLPCYCTEGQPTPNTARWVFSSRGSDITLWSYPNTVNDRYKDRVIISSTPGNLSLRLSDLTLSDEGLYSCEADGQHRGISLTVKGCSLSASTEVTGYTRGSVVLPCYCTEGQPKPNYARWVFSSRGSGITLWSYPNTVNDSYKHRVNISSTPGNLSLRLSDLTWSDGGTYSCEADGQHRNIRLTVKGVTTQSPGIIKHTSTRGSKPTSKTEISEDLKKSILYATIAAVVAAVAVCGAVLFYCRVRSRKNAHVESREEQEIRTGEQVEEKNADSVTYSTVVHSKTVKNTNIQNPSEYSTEYASIKRGMSSYL